MKLLRSILGGFVAAAFLALATGTAEATLEIRVSSFNSAGTLLQSQTASVGTGSQVFSTSVTDFNVVIATNVATTGGLSTSHSETINFTYSGASNATGSNSDVFVVEFSGHTYTAPPGGSMATVTSNASPSTSGLNALFAQMISGVFSGVPFIPLVGGPPLPIPAPAGILGTTTGTGSLGNASSVLMPNPVTGSSFTTPGGFSFYQRFTFGQFTNTGSGSVSAGSTVNAVPEPGTTAMAASALPLLAIGMFLRRRYRAKA